MKTKFLRFGALAIFFAMHSTASDAHDPAGLEKKKTLPKEVSEALEAREKIRASKDAPLSGGSLPAAKAKQIAKSLKLPSAFESPEAVISARAIWPQRATLKVCFFDGPTSAQSQVFNLFREIAAYTNLTVEKDPAPCTGQKTPIRVSFRSSGYWSYVGTDAMLIPTSEPTMGLNELDRTSPIDEAAAGIIRHEIMHSFAALHEHQNPHAKCEKDLNWPLVKKELGWSETQMRTNFQQVVFSKDIIASAYDKESIMHYQLPMRYWKAGAKAECYLPHQNTRLSSGDVVMLQSIYPK